MSDQHWSQMMLPRERIEQLENANRELREENEVLREGMRKVNATAERHEREMYLAKDEAEALRAQLKETEEKGRVLMDMCRDLKAQAAEYEALTDEMDTATRHCYLSGPTVVGQFKRLRQQADEAERAGGEK